MATATESAADQGAEHVPVDEAGLTAVLLDPDTIVRDECNAREHDTEPDDDLINSVKAVDVQDPVSVRPRPDGTYGAFKGWRRAQAAQIANAASEGDGRAKRQIKAFVRADLVGRDAWTRFLSLIENHQREGMSAKDTLKAAELSLIGMDEVEQKAAARALGLKRGTGQRLARAQELGDAALRRASAGGMDLEQMATFAEVADLPDAERRLLRALARDEGEEDGGRGHWEQELALLKAEQGDRAARQEAIAALERAEILLLPAHVPYGEKDTAHRLADLTSGLGNLLAEDNHKNCPGHSARLDDEHQPVWYCADPAAYGHKVRPKPKAKPERTAEDEAKAAERARTTACNRAWKAAAGPRQEFVSRLVRASKALPEDAWKFAASVLLDLPHFYGKWAGRREAEDVAGLLGVKLPESSSERVFLSELVSVSKARLPHVLFAHVAAAFERDMRDPKGWNGMQVRFLWEAPTPQQVAYLLLLEKLGQDDKGSYRLSEVEEQALAPHRGADTDTT